VYDATIAFAGLDDSDKIPTDDGDGGDEDENDRPKEPSKEPRRRVRLYDVNVGNYVQWTSGGVDQFKPPRRITRMEGEYAFVHGSLTGIPMAELTVVDPPAALPPVAPKSPKRTTGRDPVIDTNLRISDGATRLQITADVDLDGLRVLRDMLDKYEEILRLMATPQNQLPDGPPEKHEA
jgi:hypothetical protein